MVCRSLSLGYAKDAMQTTYFGGNLTRKSYSGVKCLGHERWLEECVHDANAFGFCEGGNVAAVYCVDKMADLVNHALYYVLHLFLMSLTGLFSLQFYFVNLYR